MSKEILVFTLPFRGSTTVYGSFADEFLPKKVGLLVVAGWENVSPKLTQWHDSIVLNGPSLQESHPTLWTLPRAAHLLPKCISLIEDLKPKLVIADYRSLEAIIAAQKTKTPVFVSIPTVIGPFKDKKGLYKNLNNEANIRALLALKKQGVRINSSMLDMIFGNFHLPGNTELIHSYDQVLQADYKDGRIAADYLIIGNHRAEQQKRKDPLWNTPTIFISFGKRIMELLDSKDISRENLSILVKNLANKFADPKLRVVFETYGHNVLPDYPDNWLVTDEFKEKDGLPPKTVLILPGDSDSFHDGLLHQMPMIIVPFVDSQKLVGERVEALGVGVNLGRDWPLGNAYTGDYFSNESKGIGRVPDIIDDIFGRFGNILSTYDGMKLTSESFYKLIKSRYHLGLPVVPEKSPDSFSLERGQLVFGTDIARLYLEKAYGLEGRLNIRRGEPFSTIALSKNDLPATVDKYLDALRYRRTHAIDLKSGMENYVRLLQSLDIFLNGETDLAKMCIKGLDFFAELFGVKFLIDHFDPKLNYITTREIVHILDRKDQFASKAFFYHEVGNKWQEILPRNVASVLEQVIGWTGEGILADEMEKRVQVFWEKGVYLDTDNPEDIAIIRQEINKKKGDGEFTLSGELKRGKGKEKKSQSGIEEIVFNCASRLKKNSKNDSFGLVASVSHGLIQQNGLNKNAVVVMLRDSLGRTAIGKADELQFPDADQNILLQNAFSNALQQIE